MTVPIIRKQVVEPPKVQVEFRVVTEPQFNEAGEEEYPPHWEMWAHGEDQPFAWGRIETAQPVWRVFQIASIASALLPPGVIEATLKEMARQQSPGITSVLRPEVINDGDI